MIVTGHNKTFGGDRNVRYLDGDGHFVCVSVKAHQIVYFMCEKLTVQNYTLINV